MPQQKTMIRRLAVFGPNGNVRYAHVSLPLIESISNEAHYQPAPTRPPDLPGEHRAPAMTAGRIRRALGRDRRRSERLQNEIAFQAVMSRIERGEV